MKKLPVLLLACLLLFGCSGQPLAARPGGAAFSAQLPARTGVESSEPQFATPAADDKVAIIETSAGTMYAVLYTRLAPLAVRNFITLAETEYYNGTPFHRVVPGFVIQGGDATGTGEGGESIWGQPYQSETNGKMHHYSGALCTAVKTGTRDENTSQFYIVTTPQGNLDDAALQKLTEAGMRDVVVEAYRQAGGAPWLDYNDTVFGQLYGGMDVADRIGSVPTDEDGRPTEAVTIVSITLSTVGENAIPGLTLEAPVAEEAPAEESPAEDAPASEAAPPAEGDTPAEGDAGGEPAAA